MLTASTGVLFVLRDSRHIAGEDSFLPAPEEAKRYGEGKLPPCGMFGWNEVAKAYQGVRTCDDGKIMRGTLRNDFLFLGSSWCRAGLFVAHMAHQLGRSSSGGFRKWTLFFRSENMSVF